MKSDHQHELNEGFYDLRTPRGKKSVHDACLEWLEKRGIADRDFSGNQIKYGRNVNETI